MASSEQPEHEDAATATGADQASVPLQKALESLLQMGAIQQSQQETVARLAAEVQRQGAGLDGVSTLARAFDGQTANIALQVQDCSRQLVRLAELVSTQTERLERQDQELHAAVATLHAEIETLRRQTQADEWERELGAAQERAAAAEQRTRQAEQQACALEERLKLKEQEVAETMVQAVHDKEQDRESATVFHRKLLETQKELAEREQALSEATARLERAAQRTDTLDRELADLRQRIAQVALLFGQIIGQEDQGGTLDNP